jgi:ribosome maturation protein SDO1
VSLVRLKKGKKRFEIACYKNKVLEYRSGLEDNLDEVLQIPSVFLNVSKGATAPREDLDKAFGKDKSTDDIVLEILQKGELQVGEKERAAQLDRVHAEVIDIVTSRLVDPNTKRVYTPGIIAKALDQLSAQSAQARQEEVEQERHARKEEEKRRRESVDETSPAGSGDGENGKNDGADAAAKQLEKTHLAHKPLWNGVSANKGAKSQALDAMKALVAWQPIPVARARMKLRVSCHVGTLKQPVKAAAANKPEEAEGKGGKEGKGKAGKGHKRSGSKNEPAAAGGDEGDKGKAAGGGTVKDRILSFFEVAETQGANGEEWEVVGFVEPGAFKGLGDFIGSETRGRGRVEVLDMAVKHED